MNLITEALLAACFITSQRAPLELDDHAVAIVFDFVDPVGAGWHFGPAGRDAGLERYATHAA